MDQISGRWSTSTQYSGDFPVEPRLHRGMLGQQSPGPGEGCGCGFMSRKQEGQHFIAPLGFVHALACLWIACPHQYREEVACVVAMAAVCGPQTIHHLVKGVQSVAQTPVAQ